MCYRNIFQMIVGMSIIALTSCSCSTRDSGTATQTLTTTTRESTPTSAAQVTLESVVVTGTPEPSENNELSNEIIVNSEDYNQLRLRDVHFLWDYNKYIDEWSYIRVQEESSILPFSVARARMSYMEFEIPIERITKILITDDIDEVHFYSLENEEHILYGSPSSWVKGGAIIELVGIDSSGAQVTIKLSRGAPSASIEFISKGEVNLDFDWNSYQYMGTCTNWDGEEYPIIENLLEPIEFGQGEDSQTIDWGPIRMVQILEDKPSKMIENGLTVSPFWSEATIILADDKMLEGQIKSQSGYVTGVRQDGILVHISANALKEISISQ